MPQTRLTKTEILQAVRDITELDTDDVSDSVLTLYLRDGYNRIIDLERRWPFLEVKFTLTTTPNVNEYTVDDFTTDDIREVISIYDPDNVRLEFVDYDQVEEWLMTPTTPQGRSTFFSFWGNKLYLFPIPTEADALTVRAYRYPNNWVSSNTYPDGPVGFDLPLVYYVVSRVYQSQEEIGTAREWERSFTEGIGLVRRDQMRPESSAPVVFAGGRQLRRWKGTDWDSTL
jgi:hypothetical protein